MQTKDLKKTALLATIAVLIAFVLLGSATYAWFTYNSKVSTDKITAKTSGGNVGLLLSETRNPFVATTECAIVQVNTAKQEELFPVSTADLVTFVYNNGAKLTDETSYYHGQIYVQATGAGIVQTRMAIYLDNTEDLFVNDENNKLLNAARIGLVFEGLDPVIMRLSDENNPATEQVDNTMLNGVRVESGKPIYMDSAGNVSLVDDPSISVTELGIKTNTKARPLAKLEIGKIYQLDIYFYLEGTDPDCSGSLQKNGATIQLAFYGALTEE